MPPRSSRKPPVAIVPPKGGPRRSGSESARVYDSIRRQILEGRLTPATHLSQRAIAEAEQTSNGPVIYALRRLAFEGLLVHERSHGYRVCDWSESGLEDQLTVRRALETEAARLAAEIRATPADIVAIARKLEE